MPPAAPGFSYGAITTGLEAHLTRENDMRDSLVDFVTRGIATQAAVNLEIDHANDARREIGTKAVKNDFYSDKDVDLPVDKIRWCVKLVKWDGERWRPVRRLTGPLSYVDALTRTEIIAKAKDLKRVN